MKYGVFYSSIGCLPDDHSGPYDTIEEAAEYIRDQYEMALDSMNDADHEREPSDKEAPDVSEIARWRAVADPREGSLYYWEITELSDDRAKEWEEANA